MLEWRRFLPDVPPPPFASAEDVLRDTLSTLAPRRRITVPAWAQESRHMDTPFYQGLWQNGFSPYMTEPATMATSRRYKAVVFVGPSRAGKSEPLALNTIGHAIEAKPRDMLVVCQTQDSAKAFSEKKLGPMLRANPDLAMRQLTGRGADNLHQKKFKGGMHLVIGWPVIGFFSQNEYFTVIITDRDRMVDDVDGEGDPLMLAIKRTQHAGSLGIAIEESSPGRPIERDDWEPATPHEAPPCAGILADYNLGTRGQFYWQCPHCQTWFRPTFSALHWEACQTHGETAKTAYMACPNGCVIEHDRKAELNATGRWLHEAGDGQTLVEIGDDRIRDTDIVSYWCEGPVAAMQSWDQLVLRYLQAKQTFDDLGDETALKATVTLDQGRPYEPAVRQIGEGMAAETLKALAERRELRVAPAATRFVTMQVDVQGNRFVVSAEAWGEGLEHWLIDRFDIALPPEGAPGAGIAENGDPLRAIDPPRYAEDWQALMRLFDRAYPVAGSGYALLPRAVIIDTGGAPGVTANAYKFDRAVRKAGLGHRFFLAKGIGGLNQQRAVYASPEKVLGTRRKRVTDIRIVAVGTDPLKDEVALSLTRKEPGPGAYHLPDALPETAFAEFCAEVRTEKGWVLRKHGLRNESLDLAVYARALAIVLKAEKIDWTNPPEWAAPAESNGLAQRIAVADAEPNSKQQDAAPRPSPRRESWIGRNRNWLS